MPVHDDLGIRMKENYENISKTRLVRRMPVAIRIDGKAFHTFTRGFVKPYDWFLIRAMQQTTKYLCENIQGCVFGYTQSDEISLILVDYAKLESCAWFDNEVQKICSIAASMATMAFNKIWYEQLNIANKIDDKMSMGINTDYDIEAFATMFGMRDLEDDWINLFDHLPIYHKVAGTAMFDARCFNIPKEEVTNLIYWRQLDATRNSIQMLGQATFSHKELQGLSCNMIQNKLFEERGINWNELPIVLKRGTAVIKLTADGWYICQNMPVLKGEDRSFVDSVVFVGEDS
jgi:tRNA(His) 5'-end guanylyltransferase